MTHSEDSPQPHSKGDRGPESNPLAFAFGWVGRMTTVVLEMILPGLGGHWLDARWETHYWALLGFGLGFGVGLFHLLQMLKQNGPSPPPSDSEQPTKNP